jgi:hypothetical protein
MITEREVQKLPIHLIRAHLVLGHEAVDRPQARQELIVIDWARVRVKSLRPSSAPLPPSGPAASTVHVRRHCGCFGSSARRGVMGSKGTTGHPLARASRPHALNLTQRPFQRLKAAAAPTHHHHHHRHRHPHGSSYRPMGHMLVHCERSTMRKRLEKPGEKASKHKQTN